MNETQKHKDAFEYWFSLGATTDNKTCESFASHLQVHVATFWRWYKAFNWRNRADIRNNANAKKIAEKTDNAIVNRKAKELEDLDTIDTVAMALIKQVITKDEEGRPILKIKITDDRGFAQVAGAIEKTKKLKQLLLGEDTERTDNTFRVIVEGVDISKFPTK